MLPPPGSLRPGAGGASHLTNENSTVLARILALLEAAHANYRLEFAVAE